MAAWSECEWRDTFSGGEPGTTEVAKNGGRERREEWVEWEKRGRKGGMTVEESPGCEAKKKWEGGRVRESRKDVRREVERVGGEETVGRVGGKKVEGAGGKESAYRRVGEDRVGGV